MALKLCSFIRSSSKSLLFTNNSLNFQKKILNECKIKLNKPNENYGIYNQQTSFSTTTKTNAIPPLIWLFAKPITKLGAIVAGRYFKILASF